MTTPPTPPRGQVPGGERRKLPVSQVTSLNYDWTALNNADRRDGRQWRHQPDHRPGAWHADADRRAIPTTRPRCRPTPRATSFCCPTASTPWTAGTAMAAISRPGRHPHGAGLHQRQGRRAIVIYTIFVDLNGTQGNSTVLQNCATDSSKYFDLTTVRRDHHGLQPDRPADHQSAGEPLRRGSSTAGSKRPYNGSRSRSRAARHPFRPNIPYFIERKRVLSMIAFLCICLLCPSLSICRAN